MELFLFYLLRVSLVMTLLYGFYKLFLSKVTFYAVNRVVLWMITGTSLLLPLFSIRLLPQASPQPILIPMNDNEWDISQNTVTQVQDVPFQIPWMSILLSVFLLGFLFFSVRYLLGLFQLLRLIRTSEKQTYLGTQIHVTDKNIDPFSWFRYILISRRDLHLNEASIIYHECAHTKLKHSLDRFFLDIFACFFWFNPFAWLLRRELQTVHEFQADETVLQHGIDAQQYQYLLIRKSVGEVKFAMANSFLQRDLHKRIKMMMKNKAQNNRKWKYALFLSAMGCCLMLLSTSVLNAQNEPNAQTEEKTMDATAPTTINEQNSIMVAEAVDTSNDPLILKNARVVSAEEVTISGIIKDESTGEVIAGAIVRVQGSDKGVTTAMDGSFKLIVPKNSVVKFMMVGYQSFKLKVQEDMNNLLVSLKKGEGEDKTGREFVSIKIDDSPTFNSEKQPLYIVDGRERKDLHTILPDDIESLTVLKDKSAVELYGERAKNGVILITMRKKSDAAKAKE